MASSCVWAYSRLLAILTLNLLNYWDFDFVWLRFLWHWFSLYWFQEVWWALASSCSSYCWRNSSSLNPILLSLLCLGISSFLNDILPFNCPQKTTHSSFSHSSYFVKIGSQEDAQGFQRYLWEWQCRLFWESTHVLHTLSSRVTSLGSRIAFEVINWFSMNT